MADIKKAPEPRQRSEGSKRQSTAYRSHPNLSTDYASYTQTVFQPLDIVEFRLIKEGQVRKHWRDAQDCLPFEARLHKWNQQGWNIFIGVNPRVEFNTSGDGNVKRARWLFADFDHIEPGDGCGRWEFISDRIHQAGLDMPDLVISSGNGLHTYWRLSHPLTDLERWRTIQEKLIATVESDPVIKNPERIMRVPGFKNLKDMSNPKDCFIILENRTND